jgi:hypothetical protein
MILSSQCLSQCLSRDPSGIKLINFQFYKMCVALNEKWYKKIELIYNNKFI